MDHLVKATAEGVRVYAAITTDLVNEGINRHDCHPLSAVALGRTMTGALLMAANLKNKEALTIKFNGNGPIGSITVDATQEGYVRGYVAHPKAELPLCNGKLAVGKGIGKGIVSVTRFTGMKNPVTGSCEIFSGEIAEDLTKYLLISEQTPSSVGLCVLVGDDYRALVAGGFIVQPLPSATDEIISKLEKNLREIRPISEIMQNKFNAKDIIAEVLDGFDIKYLTSTELMFKCQCSKRRTEDILLALRHDDLKILVNDGHAEVCCQFCGEKYEFTKEELVAILHVSDELRRRRGICE